MLTTFSKFITGTAFLGSLFWFSAHDWVALLLFAAWIIAIAVVVRSNRVDRFLWIPAVIALAGVLGSVLVLAIPAGITLAANEATLVMFIISFEVLKRRSGNNQVAGLSIMKHHAYQ
jgi:hypothetical protein